jgi:hypothetical protein
MFFFVCIEIVKMCIYYLYKSNLYRMQLWKWQRVSFIIGITSSPSVVVKIRILSETWGHWTESLQEMRFLGPLQNIFISSCRRNNMVAIWAILVSFWSTETLNKISETTSRNNLIDTNNVGDIFHSIFSFRMETINNIFHVPFSLFLINKI